MNFKSLINDICCDGRIKDGIFDFRNQEHVFVLQEYLEKAGCDVNYVVEKTAKLFEAGRFPERQAYNKDGILVTFPSKEYKDRAVNKGTHFAENPKKSDANIFTTPPPDVKAGGSEDSIYNADVEKPKDVSIDQELSDKNVDNLLRYATDKDKFAELIIKKQPELTDDNVFRLLYNATDIDKIVKILGTDNINKLSDNINKLSDFLFIISCAILYLSVAYRSKLEILLSVSSGCFSIISCAILSLSIT